MLEHAHVLFRFEKFGLFRYLYLLNHSGDAESPELLMLRDAPLLAAIVAWIVVAGAVLVLN